MLEELAEGKNVHWNPDHQSFQATCPICSSAATFTAFGETVFAQCLNRCGDRKIKTAWKAATATTIDAVPNNPSHNGHVTNGNGQHSLLSIPDWKARVFSLITKAYADWEADELRKLSKDKIALATLKVIDSGLPYVKPPSDLSRTEQEEEIDALVDLYWGDLEDRGVVPKEIAIAWETYSTAVVANEAYLRRTPVVAQLCYSSAVSMITGGKHAGKSTLARWMAICVSKGWQFLGRDVTQGPVFYIASEDETMAARQELMRLGWRDNDPLKFLSAQQIPELDNPRKFLAALTREIRTHRAVMVVLDMLFDFVRIEDEMSYAGTREAVGYIQNVASDSESHIVAVHHAPKHAQIGDAAIAALGSQGLAARVSPIVLVRRFGPGVHSVSSTDIRDPRGKAIVDSKLIRNADGSMELGGGWKNYMLAEVYAERVTELLGAEAGSEMTAVEVAEALDIAYQVAKSTLSMLFKNGQISRDGEGRKGKPFRYSAIVSDITVSYDSSNEPKSGTYTPLVPNVQSAETGIDPELFKPRAYKD